MRGSDKSKEWNKAQYNLGRQTVKIFALSSINVGKYEALMNKDVLPEKDLLEKAAAIKRFEYVLSLKEKMTLEKNSIKY